MKKNQNYIHILLVWFAWDGPLKRSWDLGNDYNQASVHHKVFHYQRCTWNRYSSSLSTPRWSKCSMPDSHARGPQFEQPSWQYFFSTQRFSVFVFNWAGLKPRRSPNKGVRPRPTNLICKLFQILCKYLTNVAKVVEFQAWDLAEIWELATDVFW